MDTVALRRAALGLTGRTPLFIAGQVPPAPRLAIVGSRAAHRRFRDAVEPLVAAASCQGWSIVSGGAVGIDSDAHAAALEQCVPQLAVLPCGPDRVYPPQHAPLFESLARAEHSGVLFAHRAGTTLARGMFASRNAIVVGLCDAVVIVEAAPRSGTMVTARLARRRRRPRAVIAGSAGAAIVAAEGGVVLPWSPDEPATLRRTAGRWLQAVSDGEPMPSPPSPRSWPPHLQWLRDEVDRAGPSGLSLDALPSPRAGLVALTEAEALGLLVERASGRYVLAG